MLPKENRVKNKKDFDAIFKNGTGFKNSILILKFINNNLEESRFGFVVSLKVSKKAVIRNKVKRRLSEIIRSEIENIKNGLDLVFITLPGIEKKNFNETKEALNGLLIKAKCLKP